MITRRRSMFTLVLAWTITGCAGGSTESTPSPSVSEPLVDAEAFAEAFEVMRVVTLEETDEVVTVSPRIEIDAMGDLIVTEAQETQIRIYDRDGSLQTVLGRSGAGPGEFRSPTSGRRTLDGRIVASDPLLARITFFDLDSDSVATAVAPVHLLLDVDDLGAGRFLLTGVNNPGNPRPQFLHIWNSETDQIERSFLSMAVAEEERAIANSFITANAKLVGDTIWAIWALSDTVYKFSRDGDELAKIPIPLPRPTRQLPVITGQIMADEMGSMFDSITQVSDVYPTPEGDLVVQSGQLRGRLYEWDLVVHDQRGEPKLQLIGSPRLVFVDGDEFWFGEPDGLQPNRILVARRKTAP